MIRDSKFHRASEIVRRHYNKLLGRIADEIIVDEAGIESGADEGNTVLRHQADRLYGPARVYDSLRRRAHWVDEKERQPYRIKLFECPGEMIEKIVNDWLSANASAVPQGMSLFENPGDDNVKCFLMYSSSESDEVR